MGVVRDTIQGLKPVIYVAWIVAIIRLMLEANTTDLNVVAMASVYSAVFVMLLLAGFTGQLDHLVWKRLLLGAVVLGVACWFLPNAIAYTAAQFQGWDHGRFHVDEEHWAIQKRLMEEEDMGFFEAAEKAEEELGRPGTTRSAPRVEGAGAKVWAGVKVGFFTSIGGTLWCLVLGILLVGIPATVRRRRAPG